MDFLTEPLKYEFIQRALVASVAIGVSTGLIGVYIMLRRLSLIGDALAHAVLPGVIIGFMVGGKNPVTLFLGALAAGILTAILISFVERNSKIKEDTSIGIIFTGAFALGILLVSQLKQVHIDLSSYLFGDVLGVSTADIILSSIITIVIMLSVILFYKQLLITSFDPTMAQIIGISTGLIHYFLMTLLSMSIVAGLQSVGVILIIAMLITPPATAFLLTDKLKWLLFLSCVFGVGAAVVGLYLSYYFNFASGASIVLVAVVVFVIVFLFSPKEGLIIKSVRRKRISQLNMMEDVIKIIYHTREDPSVKNISEKIKFDLGINEQRSAGIINSIMKLRLVEKRNGDFRLTEKGEKVATHLVRSHRLWETYAKDKNIVDMENIHQDAEQFEHILNEELLQEIEEELGHPEKDPHGSPIPKGKKE